MAGPRTKHKCRNPFGQFPFQDFFLITSPSMSKKGFVEEEERRWSTTTQSAISLLRFVEVFYILLLIQPIPTAILTISYVSSIFIYEFTMQIERHREPSPKSWMATVVNF